MKTALALACIALTGAAFAQRGHAHELPPATAEVRALMDRVAQRALDIETITARVRVALERPGAAPEVLYEGEKIWNRAMPGEEGPATGGRFLGERIEPDGSRTPMGTGSVGGFNAALDHATREIVVVFSHTYSPRSRGVTTSGPRQSLWPRGLWYRQMFYRRPFQRDVHNLSGNLYGEAVGDREVGGVACREVYASDMPRANETVFIDPESGLIRGWAWPEGDARLVTTLTDIRLNEPLPEGFPAPPAPEGWTHRFVGPVTEPVTWGPSTFGALVPDYDFVDLNGRVVRVSDFRGKFLVLFFWSGECVACADHLTDFQALYDFYRNDPEVALFGVHTRNQERMQPMLDRLPVTFPNLRDVHGHFERMAPGNYIHTFIIGPLGDHVSFGTAWTENDPNEPEIRSIDQARRRHDAWRALLAEHGVEEPAPR